MSFARGFDLVLYYEEICGWYNTRRKRIFEKEKLGGDSYWKQLQTYKELTISLEFVNRHLCGDAYK